MNIKVKLKSKITIKKIKYDFSFPIDKLIIFVYLNLMDRARIPLQV